MASKTDQTLESLSFEDVFKIVKDNDKSRHDLVYRTLMKKPEYFTKMPDTEDYSILHNLVIHGQLDLFNKIIALPNLNFILLTRTATKPPKDILKIAVENRNKSNTYKELSKTIAHLVEIDKFVDHGKINQINECKKMLETNEDLVNQKPPYRKYYLIHHLAFLDNRTAFDQIRQMCKFDMTLLTNDQKTASEVAFENNHKEFGEYLESLSPEMRQIREKHEQERKKPVQIDDKQNEKLEKFIVKSDGQNLLNCYTCPITKEIFQDPVILSDGFTYERSAIQQYLKEGKRRSPMTNIELTDTNLIPNLVIKQALNELSSQANKQN